MLCPRCPGIARWALIWRAPAARPPPSGLGRHRLGEHAGGIAHPVSPSNLVGFAWNKLRLDGMLRAFQSRYVRRWESIPVLVGGVCITPFGRYCLPCILGNSSRIRGVSFVPETTHICEQNATSIIKFCALVAILHDVPLPATSLYSPHPNLYPIFLEFCGRTEDYI